MVRLDGIKRLEVNREKAYKALKTLEIKVEQARRVKPSTEQSSIDQRDILIKRFEYSYESFWKYLRDYLEQYYDERIEQGSRTVFRTAMKHGLIMSDELDVLLQAVDDRNITAHDYAEERADAISRSIPEYYTTMMNVLKRIERLSNPINDKLNPGKKE